jgi:beta-lactamase regulating signal transducer with metallopeptidase domain
MIPIDSLLAAIGHTLWGISVQVSVLIAFIGILALFFRKSSSSFRYFLWCIVLVRLCIPLKLELPLPSWSYLQSLVFDHLPFFTRETALPSILNTLPQIPLISGGTAASGQIIEIQPLVKPDTLPIILAVFWLFVVLGAGILIVRYILHTHRHLERCPSIERVELVDLLRNLCRKMRIKRPVPLRYLAIASHNEPSVVGIFRPAIYLPQGIADTWNVRDIEPVLLHELSHIRRHDLLINMVQAFIQVFYFFHPLVWFANWRIRVLREEVCDDMSIRMLDLQRSHYIKSILNFIEEPQTKSSWGFSGIGFSEGYGSIQKRVRRIMKINYKASQKLSVLSVALLVAVGAAGLVLSSEQTGIEKTLTGDKTYTALEKTGVFDKIKIRAGEPMNEEKKKLIGKYISRDTIVKNKIRFYIATGWSKQLKLPNVLKRAPINLVEAVNRYTNLDAKFDTHLSLDSPKIFEVPFIYITSDKSFNLTKAEAGNFGEYLRNGGFAFIDNGAPEDKSEKAASSLKKMLLDALGSEAILRPIPDDYVIYHCYYDFLDGPPFGKVGGLTNKKFKEKGCHLDGLWIGERLAAVYFDYGYGYRWINPEKSDPQIKMGVNMVVFALLQEKGIMTGHTVKSSKIDADSPQIPVEKIPDQTQKEKRKEIQVTLLENGEYDIDGTHATGDTFEKVLKAELGEYPKDYRRLFISGTPKNQSQVDLATRIARKLKAAIAVKWDNPGIHFETSAADKSSPADAFRKAAQQKKEGASSLSDNQPVISGPATDSRVIIAGLQSTFEPAGVPLTDEQQKKIIEVFDPAKPYDLRQIAGVFTLEQKKVFVKKHREQLAKSAYPLTSDQESRMMAFGPNSKEKSWVEILTPEQLKIMFEANINSRQTPNEKKSEQPQRDGKSDIQTMLQENGIMTGHAEKSSKVDTYSQQAHVVKPPSMELVISSPHMTDLMKQLHLAKPITVEETSHIRVDVIKKGEYEIDGKKVKDENFLQILKQEIAKNPGRRFTFVSSTGATIDNIYEPKDLAEKNGIHISLSIDSTYQGKK